MTIMVKKYRQDYDFKMFDILKENEPEKKYSKQTVAVHL